MVRGRCAVVLVVVGACSTFDEARVPSDGGAPPVDAAPEADASDTPPDPRRFCERFVPDGGQTLFCRDFDDGREVLFDWDGSSIAEDGGSITLDETLHVSPPASFRARLAASSPSCSYARTTASLGPLPASVHVAFDVRLGGEGTRASESLNFMALHFGKPSAGAADCLLLFSAKDTGGNVHEQVGPSYQHPMSRFPRPGRWTHLDVLLDRTSRVLDVRVDGAPAFTTVQTLREECLGADSELHVSPGMHCESTVDAPRELRIDDLVVTGSP